MFSNSLVVDDELADDCHNLGYLYADQGKLVEAERMYQRALEGYEKAWGPEHTSTLDTVNNLGVLYASQGKMAEAEAMYLRALQGKEKAWGAEHTLTLDTRRRRCACGRCEDTRRLGKRSTHRHLTRAVIEDSYEVLSQSILQPLS